MPHPSFRNTKLLGLRVSRTPRYSGVGKVTPLALRNLSLPPELERRAVTLSNAALAKNTWRSYTTGERSVQKCSEHLGEDLSMPWTTRKAAIYITWAANTKKWSPSTLQQYLSAIKSAHKREGWDLDWFDHQIRNLVKGFDNLSEPRTQRLPITPDLMKVIKGNLGKAKIKKEDKLLIWAVSVIMYAGSFRGSEIMGLKEMEFEEDKILLNKNIKINEVCINGENVKMILAKIKNPKEMKGRGTVTVEMFQQDTWLCPVKALEMLRRERKEEEESPFAKRSNGKLLTIRLFNQLLQMLLKDHLSYEEGTISSHSFRAGIATAMARAGYSDEEIQRVGRWKSDSFLKYIKLGRSSRLEQQLKLMRKLAMIGENDLRTQ